MLSNYNLLKKTERNSCSTHVPFHLTRHVKSSMRVIGIHSHFFPSLSLSRRSTISPFKILCLLLFLISRCRYLGIHRSNNVACSKSFLVWPIPCWEIYCQDHLIINHLALFVCYDSVIVSALLGITFRFVLALIRPSRVTPHTPKERLVAEIRCRGLYL